MCSCVSFNVICSLFKFKLEFVKNLSLHCNWSYWSCRTDQWNMLFSFDILCLNHLSTNSSNFLQLWIPFLIKTRINVINFNFQISLMYVIILSHIPSFNFCNFLPLSSNPWLISWPTTIPIAPYAAALKKDFRGNVFIV